MHQESQICYEMAQTLSTSIFAVRVVRLKLFIAVFTASARLASVLVSANTLMVDPTDPSFADIETFQTAFLFPPW